MASNRQLSTRPAPPTDEHGGGVANGGSVICFSDNATDIAGLKFDFPQARDLLGRIDCWRRTGQRRYVAFVNPHSVMLCRRDAEMMSAVRGAAIRLADGAGIVLAARILGCRNAVRLTGPAAMLEICDSGRRLGLRHFFYGGRTGVAKLLAQRLSERFPGLLVAGTHCPPGRELSRQEDAAIVSEINVARPDVVWVGLGAPKQEKWMAEHAGRIQAPAMIGVGAAFDFHAGTVRWAPPWVRRAGLEWVYRLAQEPRRLWRRNLDGPLFLLSVIAGRLQAGAASR